MKYNPPIDGQARKLYDLDRLVELLAHKLGDKTSDTPKHPLWSIVLLFKARKPGISFGEWCEYLAEDLLCLLEYIQSNGTATTFGTEDEASVDCIRRNDTLQTVSTRLLGEKIDGKNAKQQLRTRRNTLAADDTQTNTRKAM